MSATDLIDHPDFVAFCLAWKDAGRCPIGFADWLRDRGLFAEGDAADWAAGCSMKPFMSGHGNCWSSFGCGGSGTMAIPEDVYEAIDNDALSLDFSQDIAVFFEAWAVVRPAKEAV